MRTPEGLDEWRGDGKRTTADLRALLAEWGFWNKPNLAEYKVAAKLAGDGSKLTRSAMLRSDLLLLLQYAVRRAAFSVVSTCPGY